MSTEIESNEPGGLRVAGLRRSYDGASVVVNDYVRVSRADFLAAVETECGVRIVAADAVVIERAEWPEVTPSGGSSGAGTQYLSAAGHEIADTSDASLVRVHALALLALAEYLDAHPPVPPVDENDIEALGDLIRQYGNRSDAAEIARRLLATGRVAVTR